MISFDLDFFPRADAREDICDSFDYWMEAFLNALRSNGNIFNDWNDLELEDRVCVRVVSLEERALLPENWSCYAQDYWNKTKSFCRKSAIFRAVAETVVYDFVCDCFNPTSHILRSSMFGIETPVVCGCCEKAIPLYTLPHVNQEEDHYKILGWQTTAFSFDRLWYQGGAGERFATRQLEYPQSDFMKQTRQLAAALEKESEVPTYSFLKHYYQKWGKHCPLCGRKWRWKETTSELFAFKCNHCRLISEKSAEKTLLSKLHP